uniref:Cytochrome c oxidase subunit 2 n=1 Tax=Leptoconops bezzii TaxID=209699 RepID=Q8HN10_9DIPT|nr:cytochrome oxidase subunit 2 [Leptoconops bezzii]
MATWSTMNLQDSASPLMEQLNLFYEQTFIFVVTVTVMTSYMMMTLLWNKHTWRFLIKGKTIETVWTILPMFTLLFIALPSLQLLYMMEEMNSPKISIKVMGHQWYWSYEYTDFKNMEFDSYMIPTNELNLNEFRLIEVDNRLSIPFKTEIRMIISSTDVLHAWAVPSLGTKIDAVPGRLNQLPLMIERPGLYFGQCSEICGANHSFMPIAVESISMEDFIKMIKLNLSSG